MFIPFIAFEEGDEMFFVFINMTVWRSFCRAGRCVAFKDWGLGCLYGRKHEHSHALTMLVVMAVVVAVLCARQPNRYRCMCRRILYVLKRPMGVTKGVEVRYSCAATI